MSSANKRRKMNKKKGPSGKVSKHSPKKSPQLQNLHREFSRSDHHWNILVRQR